MVREASLLFQHLVKVTDKEMRNDSESSTLPKAGESKAGSRGGAGGRGGGYYMA